MFGSDERGAEESSEENDKEEVISVLANETVRSAGSATGEDGMLCAAKERDRSSSRSASPAEGGKARPWLVLVKAGIAGV